jgi:hypothetical protein
MKTLLGTHAIDISPSNREPTVGYPSDPGFPQKGALKLIVHSMQVTDGSKLRDNPKTGTADEGASKHTVRFWVADDVPYQSDGATLMGTPGADGITCTSGASGPNHFWMPGFIRASSFETFFNTLPHEVAHAMGHSHPNNFDNAPGLMGYGKNGNADPSFQTFEAHVLWIAAIQKLYPTKLYDFHDQPFELKDGPLVADQSYGGPTSAGQMTTQAYNDAQMAFKRNKIFS